MSPFVWSSPLFVSTAQAATFTVNSTDDIPDFQTGDGVCDSTAGAGICTLRAAINEANALGGSHTINLGSGTYNLTRSGAGEEAGLTGDLDVYADLTIVGTGVATTTIDGQSLDRVFDLHTTGETLIRSLTITHGTAATGNGGGILAIGPLTLDTMTVTQNQTQASLPNGNGGGIAATGPLTVRFTTISNNTASEVGGGINGTTMTITASTISGNNAVGSGGISAQIITMNQSDVDANVASATAGGMLANSLTITNSMVSNNLANNFGGFQVSALTMVNCVVQGNTGGGGVVSGAVSITDSSFTENRGAGLSAISQPGSDIITVERSTFSRNTVGGGIRNGDAALILRHVTVTDNQTSVTTDGGGIYSQGNTTIEDSTIAGNRANGISLCGGCPPKGRGAGIAVDANVWVRLVRTVVTGNIGTARGGGVYGATSVTLQDSTIEGNQSGESGGGVYAPNAVQATGSTINNNTSPATGGGIYSNQVVLSGSRVSGNTARGAGGVLGSSIQATDSTINGNTATTDGGGGIVAPGSLQLTRSTVSGNTATNSNGGGINSSGAFTLLNATISGNIATGNGTSTGQGGGIFYNPSNSPQVAWTNSTIAANAAPRGSGVYVLSSGLEAKGMLIASNTGSADCFRVSPLTSLGHNLDGGNSCGFAGPGDLANANAGLVPLASNGGPTQTHALLASSAAIDAGDNNDCPSTDQRGDPRPRDGTGDGLAVCDIGAYEADGGSAADLGVTLTDSPDPVDVGQPFTYNAVVTNNGPLTATGVTFTLSLTAGVTIDAANSSLGSCSGTGPVTCNLGALSDGVRAVITVSVTATGPGSKTASAQVTSPVADSNANNNSVSTSTQVQAVCSPRPNLTVQTSRIGPGTIQGTLAVGRTALQPSNTLAQIQIVGLDNATITVNGATATAGQTITFPAGVAQAEVVVTRVAPGAFMARFSVTDACGAWPTLIGGGVGVL